MSPNTAAFSSSSGSLPGMPAPAAARPQPYWPAQMLQAFALRMAAQGICVNVAMMLGDHAYAHKRLAEAHTTDDEALRQLAVELFRFFEHQRVSAARMN